MEEGGGDERREDKWRGEEEKRAVFMPSHLLCIETENNKPLQFIFIRTS